MVPGWLRPCITGRSVPANGKKERVQDQTIRLAGGRTVGFADYGIADATAVLWCHGGPGSRLEPAYLRREASEAGLRIIGIDRPGYGLSAPQPGRTIAGWVPEALAVALRRYLRRITASSVWCIQNRLFCFARPQMTSLDGGVNIRPGAALFFQVMAVSVNASTRQRASHNHTRWHGSPRRALDRLCCRGSLGRRRRLASALAAIPFLVTAGLPGWRQEAFAAAETGLRRMRGS
jgi:hypothetical protein